MNDRQDPQALFQSVDALLTSWLRERQAVLTRYTELAAAFGKATSLSAGLKNRQVSLCELLVDYVSAGHFEVFIKLVEEAESFADGGEELALRLMPDITDTTEFILAYEEKYTGDGAAVLPEERDISALGEILETRMSLEDKLISRLHNKHRRLIKAPEQRA